MAGGWRELIKRYRLRHGLSQQRMADLMGVSQRTISRWERGDDNPGIAQQKRLRDIGLAPPAALMHRLAASIAYCPAPRALSRTPRLELQALSQSAIDKRPQIVNWIGYDLVDIACGVLQEMLDDRPLQRAIANKDISCVVATTRSVLQTPESARIGAFQTTITYFFHEGTLYSDAISVPAALDADCGYQVIAMGDIGRPGEAGGR